ncbi:MAG: GTPase domain-containing protein [Planctomycetes bacterium]|nr:GTPase domain-containing protein [Planctomycetota bacterium]
MTTELAQLELLAHIDDLVSQLSAWSEQASSWDPAQHGKSLVRRLLKRIEPLRARVEAPLVVATFGGTGVGKSSLVNALVGEEISTAGRQRPTTTQPIVLAHPQTDLSAYDLPLGELRVVTRDIPLLRDIVLIDCPDPDTTEGESVESNLARLHRLLPFCDVLLYVSTQQKYRSARVTDELLQAASGCRLVFVQTHADLDEDIRDDWRTQLSARYSVSDLFFVDSRRAMQEQQSGVRPTGEFGRLIDLLFRELSAAQRVRIRRANLLGLVHEVVQRARDALVENSATVEKLNTALSEQRHRSTERMASRLQDELLVSRGLWEQRLLGQITQLWGYSPFASVLRLWHSQASLLASYTLMRAKSTAQMALVGLVHGSRWLTSRSQASEADRRLEGIATLGLNDAELREAQLIISGHVHAAKLQRPLLADQSFDQLRQAATTVQDEFLTDAARRIDDLILAIATRHSYWFTRFRYELLFAILPGFLLYRAGRNFFYDTFWLNKPHLDANFYIPAALFLVLWAALFVMAFTRRLRSGLTRHIRELAQQLAAVKMGAGLFPEIEHQCLEYSQERDRLEALLIKIEGIRDQYAGASELGAVKS